MAAGTTTPDVAGLRRLSDGLAPTITVDLAVSPDQLADATRQVDEALRRPDLQPDMAIIISILLAEFAHAMPGARAPHPLRLEVAAPDTRIAGLTAPAGTPGWPPSSPRVRTLLDQLAARWGTVHENGESLLWVQLPPTATATGAASALERAITQLRQTSSYGQVAAVLADVVAPRLGATWTSFGLNTSDGVKLVDNDGVRANPPLPLDADLPITAACRTGRPILHATPADVAAQYPRMHARMAGARLQSLAHVPAGAGHKTVAVLCFGWTAAGQSERFGWVLTVLADLVADAVTRIRAQDEAAQRAASTHNEHARHLRSGRVELDLADRSVRITGRPAPVVLTGREFAVMLQLLRSAGTPQPRAALLAQVWGPARTDTSVVDVTMSRLRRKLELPELITVKDVGYVFDPARGATGATA